VQSYNENPWRLYRASQNRVVEENLRTIPRPARAIAERRNLSRWSAQRRNHKQTAAVALRAEDNPTSIRRPIRLPFVRRITSNWLRIAAAHRLHPDIEIAIPIGTVCNEMSVGRPGWFALQAAVVCHARQCPWRMVKLRSLTD